MTPCTFTLATPDRPGAIAIIQICGDAAPLLTKLTGSTNWPIARARLVNFDDIDEGLAVRLSDDIAQLMPHGGPRVIQRIVARLIELGHQPAPPGALDPEQAFPEARDRYEAIALAAVARAASPLAIDLLLDQPRRWRAHDGSLTDKDHARSARLNHLLEPPRVVVCGPPNVGKSTLGNALLGRSMSITADEPGTTRDYTTGRIDLAGLVVNWHDTPGLRTTGDAIEATAIRLAERLIASADLLIAITDMHHDWPALPRSADLRVGAKSDIEPRDDADLCICALAGDGLPDLVTRVRDLLVPNEDLTHDGRWFFDERLQP